VKEEEEEEGEEEEHSTMRSTSVGSTGLNV
jgi:hypothetical protein